MRLDRKPDLRSLFERALGLTGTKRSDYLAEVRECWPDTYRELLGLLRCHSEQDGFALEVPEPQLIVSVGPYRVIRLLGYGSTGVVYEAEHDQSQHPVALKVLRPSVNDAEALHRFQLEIEILSRLDHPAITRVIDSGTDGARPFLVMEIIDGVRLDRWLETAPPFDMRVSVLIETIGGVHCAHLNGVLHRDLKPTNILVGKDNRPKIVDFGVARVHRDWACRPRFTATGQLVGTLQYMSPEQLLEHPHHVDARSDVYSLGMIAHQALAGRLPYTLEGKTIVEAVDAIRSSDPYLMPMSGLAPELRAIITKSLAVRPTDRYQSALAFADDLTRYTRGDPVEARLPGRRYAARAYVRRHRSVLASCAIVLAILLAIVVGLNIGLRESNRARDFHRRDSNNSFLAFTSTFDVLRYLNDQRYSQGADSTLPGDRELLERLIAPESKDPFLHLAVGHLLYDYGHIEAAEAPIRSSIKLLDAAGHRDSAYFSAIHQLGSVLRQTGQLHEASELYLAYTDECDQSLGPEHVVSIRFKCRIADIMILRGEPEKAEQFLHRAAISLDEIDDRIPASLMVRNVLLRALIAQGKLDEADAIVSAVQETIGSDGWRAIQGSLAFYRLQGSIKYLRGEYKAAESAFLGALELSGMHYPQGHPGDAATVRSVGVCLVHQGRVAEGLAHVLESHERMMRNEAGDDLRIADSSVTLANVRFHLGDFHEAARLGQEALAVYERDDGLSLQSAEASLVLGLSLHAQGLAGASDCIEKAKGIYFARKGPAAPHTLIAAGALASTQRTPDSATLRAARAAAIQGFGERHPWVGFFDRALRTR